MTRKWIVFGALMAGCAWANLALACSCATRVDAGFIHAELVRLPANARGALFLPPTDGLRPIARYRGEVMIFSGAARALSPASFSIKSDAGPGSEDAQLTWLDVDTGAPRRAFRFVRKADEETFEKARTSPDWRPLLKAGKLVDISAEVRAAHRLLRVGPHGGFKPGAHYTLAYLGERADWRYPAAVEHTIDSVALPADAMQYRLVSDGPPLRRLLSLSTGSGSCGSKQPAMVQDFHYAIADAARPYQQGILFFSAIVAPGARGDVEPLVYQPTLCGGPRFGESALGGGRELMELACDAPGGRRIVRGRAGLLEVEDRLHRTEDMEIDFGQVSGTSCRGIGMLKEAIDARDARRVKMAACALPGEERRDPAWDAWRLRKEFRDGPAIEAALPRLTAQEIPAAADLLALASDADPETRSCGRYALVRLFMEEPVQDNDLPGQLGAMLKTELDSLEPRRIDEAAGLARELIAPPPELDNSHGQAQRLYERVLTPALPALVEALVSGKATWPAGIGELIASMEGAAKPAIPALLKAASSAHPVEGVGLALDRIAADDPAYRALLVRNAANPALRESAALSYFRIAGKSDPQQAMALLTEAARDGSGTAIGMLGDHGPQARASTPVLLAQLGSGKERNVRDAAFASLLKIDAGQPEIAAAIAQYLAGGADEEEPLRLRSVLLDLKGQGRALPAIGLLLQGPLMKAEKDDVKSIIVDLVLPKAQKRALLARLAKMATRP